MKYVLIPLFILSLFLYDSTDSVTAESAKYKKIKIARSEETIQKMAKLNKKYINVVPERIYSNHRTFNAEIYNLSKIEGEKMVNYADVAVFKGKKYLRTLNVARHNYLEGYFINDELLYLRIWVDNEVYVESITNVNTFKVIYKNAMKKTEE